jgi:hypothetical protein
MDEKDLVSRSTHRPNSFRIIRNRFRIKRKGALAPFSSNRSDALPGDLDILTLRGAIEAERGERAPRGISLRRERLNEVHDRERSVFPLRRLKGFVPKREVNRELRRRDSIRALRISRSDDDDPRGKRDRLSLDDGGGGGGGRDRRGSGGNGLNRLRGFRGEGGNGLLIRLRHFSTSLNRAGNSARPKSLLRQELLLLSSFSLQYRNTARQIISTQTITFKHTPTTCNVATHAMWSSHAMAHHHTCNVHHVMLVDSSDGVTPMRWAS